MARTEMPRSESFGAFVFLRDKLRLAFAVISVPLRRDWCRVLCAVCGGGRLSLGFVCCLYHFCWCRCTFASTGYSL